MKRTTTLLVMAEFCRRNGLDAEAGWYERSMAALATEEDRQHES